jgi:hypothetical protein
MQACVVACVGACHSFVKTGCSYAGVVFTVCACIVTSQLLWLGVEGGCGVHMCQESLVLNHE